MQRNPARSIARGGPGGSAGEGVQEAVDGAAEVPAVGELHQGLGVAGLGSLLSAMFESMGGVARPDGNDYMLADAIDAGLADAVNANDDNFPPEFRLSKTNRRKKD